MYQPLPFPIDSFVSQMTHVDTNNLPVYPKIQVPVELQQTYPLIIATAIDAIQQKANSNSLRVFLFNQCAQNQYNNPQFSALVEYCVKVIDAKMLNRNYTNPVQAITELVPTCVTHLCAYNVVSYPVLEQYLQPHEIAATRNIISEFQVMNNQISSITNMQRNQFAPQTPYPAQTLSQPFSSYNNGNNNGNRFNNQSFNPNQSSGVFTQAGATRPFVNTVDKFASKQYAIPKNTSDVVHIRNIEAKTNPSENIVNKDNKGTITWVPSAKYPVIYAFDPNTHYLELELDFDGIVKPTIKTKDIQMNINDHLTQPSFANTSVVGVSPKDTASRVYNTQSTFGADTQELEKSTLPGLSLNENNKIRVVDTSIKDVSFHTDLMLRNQSKTNNSLNVARSIGYVVDPLVTNKDIMPFIEKLLLAKSLIQIQTELRIVKNELDNKQECLIDSLSLTFLNNRITKIYNHYLSNYIAVPFGKIDSFIDDLGDSLDYIGKKYGENIVKCLLNNEQELIDSFLNIVKDTTKQNLDDDHDVTSQYPDLFTIYFNNNFTLTCVDLYANELRMDLPKIEVASAITERLTPLFHSIVQNCILHKEKNQLDNYRVIIKTLDGYYLEINSNFINRDLLMVSLYTH